MVDPTETFDDFLPEALRRRSPVPLVDIGANLTHASFARDLEAVLARARAANVTTLILTGTDREHAEQAVELARRHPGLHATAGVHPHDASRWDGALAAAMRDLHRQPEVVAVGEGVERVRVGDRVVLLGRQDDDEITPDEWAARLGTITKSRRHGRRLTRRANGIRARGSGSRPAACASRRRSRPR